MNITDISIETEIPKDILEAIFKKQYELIEQYKIIEGMENLLNTVDDNINTAKGQKWIKDFAWRVHEELCEAIEAKTISKEHYIEEVTDALHFITELSIIAGYNSTICDVMFPTENKHEMEVSYALGLMCNCLKNKPWKQTQMLTDKPKFEKYLRQAWKRLIGLYFAAGYGTNDIYILYMKKHGVNNFRIRSKY